MIEITESDWKKWKKLRLKCIDDFCHTTFEEVRKLSAKSEPVHDRHRKLYQLVTDRDTEIEQRFDPLRRSSATYQILCLYRDELISDTDVGQFSHELCSFLKERKNL